MERPLSGGVGRHCSGADDPLFQYDWLWNYNRMPRFADHQGSIVAIADAGVAWVTTGYDPGGETINDYRMSESEILEHAGGHLQGMIDGMTPRQHEEKLSPLRINSA